MYVPNWASPVDLMWEDHRYARFLWRLASFSRLILFDKRGSGASDPVPLGALPTLEEWSEDIRTVMDAVGPRLTWWLSRDEQHLFQVVMQTHLGLPRST